MFRRIILLLFLLSILTCVHPPEKPDPPFVVLQYLNQLGGTKDSQNSTEDCPSSGFTNFNPGAIFDTGQTNCYDSFGLSTPCPGTGQDGQYVNIPNARNFVGPTQHCKYSSDYTTLDTVHGLTWKTCAQGQSGANCGGGAVLPINWTNANGNNPGSCSELNTINGGKGYAGITNWRIPKIRELASLLHYSNNPHINTSGFPGTFTGSNYWSSSINFQEVNENFIANFSNINLSIDSNGFALLNNLRCVSGNPIPAPSFTDNGNGTVTDSNTGLLWLKCTIGLSGPACADPPAIFSDLDWNAAINNCEALNFAGRTNWRLPNVNELLSILDHSAGGPTLVHPIFPNTDNVYWSSTTYDNNKLFKLVVIFGNGKMAPMSKDSLIRARCVSTN